MSEPLYHVYVYLAGDTKMLLCSVFHASAVADVVKTLCGAHKPAYSRIEIEIGVQLPGG